MQLSIFSFHLPLRVVKIYLYQNISNGSHGNLHGPIAPNMLTRLFWMGACVRARACIYLIEFAITICEWFYVQLKFSMASNNNTTQNISIENQ